jgi:hypothetical protein
VGAESRDTKSSRSAWRLPRCRVTRPPMQRTTTQGSGAEPESAMETSNTSPDQAQESSKGSDQHHGSQPGSQHPKASNEQVWYLKSIEFTSPSGETRTYNVITQNYNGCAVCHYLLLHFPGSWHALTYRTTEQTMFVHRDMQYPDPARTDRDTSPRSQERFVRIPRPTRRRTHPAHRTRRGRVCSAIDDASDYQ